MRFQNQGMEFTYQEAYFLKKELKEDLTKTTPEKVVARLQSDKKLVYEYGAERLILSILAMNTDEYKDFCEYMEYLHTCSKIPIMKPFIGTHANIVTVIPCHKF